MADLKALHVVFNEFCLYGNHGRNSSSARGEIDGSKVVKLAKDCKVIDRKFTRNQVDLIFHKAKPSSRRKIDFEEFVECTRMWAEAKGVSHNDLVRKIVSCADGPKTSGTIPDAVKFYDDKSRYTGVHKNGGPDTGAVRQNSDPLADLLDRSPADVRGIKVQRRATERPSIKNYQFKSDSSVQRGDKEGKLAETPDFDDLVVRKEGTDFILHPDWKRVKNNQSKDVHDRFFYVNKVTNERMWSIPTVPTEPPEQ